MDDFDSATYSIESEPDRKRVSLDDVILPTVRRSAIQIVSLSPRRQSKRPVPMTTIGADNSTMQVTKLVLKTPPGSPKRQPKAPGIIIKSIQTLAGPGLTGGSDLERECVVPKTNSVLTENRNLSIPASDDPASYRIVPILSPQNKDMRKEFEVRRTERERATNDFQDFLRESFKENKTPPSTPPPLSSVPVSSSAIEVIRISDKGSSDADSTSMSVLQLKSTVKTGIQKTAKEEIRAINYETQRAVPEIQLSSTTKQAIADPHAMLVQTRNHPETVLPSNETIATESINPPQGEASGTTSIIVHPPQSENQESHVAVELEKPPPSSAMRPKPISKAFSSATKSAVVEDPKKKEKSYDPAKAREFMKEQQAKRRLEKKEAPVGVAGSCKGAVEKDLIKQRLETLRKSSQKLVSKNLQKARKRSVSCAPKESANGNKHAPSGKMKEQALVQCNDRTSSVRPTMGLRKFASTPTLRLVKTEKSDLKPANAPKPKPAVVQTKESLPNVPKPPSAGSRDSDARTGKDSSSSRSANPSTTSTVSKPSFKIGIMRKPDNLSLDDIAQQSPLKGSQSVSIPPGRGKVNAQLIVINADQDVEEPTKEAEKELKLQVPDVMLVPTNASTLPVNQQHESAVIPADLEENDKPMIPQSLPVKSIPPWLKQSLRQPDPYPFILAVRKKLEAVQTVREERNKPTNNQEQNIMPQVASSRYNSYMNEIESVPIIRKKPTTDNRHKEANATNKQSSGSVLDNGGSSIVTKISPYSSPNTTSEISSIKSDIALPLPPLLSSTKIEKPAGQFCPTPTSGPISPLSMDKISQMKVATPGQTSTIKSPNRSVEVISNDIKKQEKARPLSPPRPHVAVQQSLNMSHMDRSQKELEYQRLLESFNRSLTHVIEVNQQLYSALKNVPAAPAIPPFPQDVLRIRDEMTQTSLPIPRIPMTTVTDKVDSDPQSGKASEATTTTASNYSDDFEHQSQTEAPPLPEQTHHDIVAASPASSPATSSASTSSSSSANSSARSDSSDSNTKSSSQSSTSSSFDHDREASSRRVQNRPETNATDDERKATSNTTTAHSSDFDSRSFSLSDSHNNTTNNHPPMPEEYLPSFEESLRKNQQSVDKQYHQLIGQRKDIQPGQKEISRESSISEEIQPSQGEERSFSFKHSENANDLKVNSVPLITSSSEESLLKNESQAQSNRDSLAYMENADATINSDLLAAMFNRTDLEVSILSTTVSETNLSYSSIGMFDQLIQSERSKEDHLVSRVHSKQKALLNRAKGQLAWLELQKQRYREKGMTDQITAIKKKQRAILLRLQKDRTELNRALKSSTESSRTMTANDPVLTSKMVDSKLNSYCSSPVPNNSGSFTLRKSSNNIRIARHQRSHTPEDANRKLARTTTTTSNSIQIAIRGRELEPNDRLEDILLRREEELRKRKEHVQRLLEWHRKLEREEEQLIAVEDRLLAYNTRKLEPANTSRQEMTLEERVQRIEKSLKTLQSIPTTVARKDDDGTSVTQEHDERYSQMSVKGSESEEEIVLTGGSKLNRFWYRLTGIEEQRYKPGRNYPITRFDMETLFEEAKRCVLSRFESKDNHLKEALLEQSIKIIPRKGNEADANTTVSVEDTGSLQSTAVGEETVRTVEQLGEDEVVGTETHDTVTIITNETTETEHSEAVNQEEPNATSSELPPMEEDEKCLLSSTVNGWSPGSRKSIESVEFHTLEETTTQYQSTVGNEQDATVEEEPIKSESYSITFEDQSVGDVEAGEEGQQLIEDMSLPPMLLNNTSLNIDSEDSESTSSCESSATVELSVPLVTEEKVLEELANQDGNDLDTISSDTSISIAQSLEEASESSSISNVTTPTTVTPTLGIETIDNQDFPDAHLFQEDDRKDDVKSISPAKSPKMALETSGNSYEDEIFHTKSSSTSAGSAHGITSELAKRLATLHDELEELSETLERTPLMKSPVTAVSPSGTKSDQLEDQNSSEETITFDYDEDGDGVTPPSADLTKDQDGTPSNDPTVSLNSAKIEVKLRSKVMGSSDTIAIVSGSNSVYNRDYPTPSQQLYHHQLQNHQQEGMSASSSAAPNLDVRMPDIINEAEVLRRQQLQIEQEIKELEQQVGFFREIPNKPPPPYIPPANGSPLALLFPSETRIDELIDGRVEELHRDRIAPENLLSDHVTNVYEKLILDMCKELYHDLRPADPTVSFRTIPHDKRPLVKRKPDQVDEILKQETHDDDARWTNFDREEIEVKDRITDELLKSLLAEALHDMVEAHERKGKDECLIQRQESAILTLVIRRSLNETFECTRSTEQCHSTEGGNANKRVYAMKEN
uniref:CAP-Gly domain-containing protein n=1 Tax=Anopheles minimus TaxID=112268 RepID=A0A182VSJ7_9DIPT